MSSLNEIVVYHADELKTHIEVRIEDETIWLAQQQIVELFDSSKANISEHIKHIFESGELDEQATVRNFRTVRNEGKRKVTRDLLHYSLDMILSVGYRVNSKRGTQFRIWANQVLKSYLLKGYAVNQRMERIENNYENLSKEVKKISLQLKTQDLPTHGIFFEGQIFDAYVFVADIIKKAKTDIILIDNYVDESVLNMLVKRPKNVTATIYTKIISKQLLQDLNKHNSQYPEINTLQFKEAHDRFLIIDEKELYHIGGSLKDLGKKWFAFSRMDSFVNEVLLKLKKGGKDE
jgi:uncharacterized protein (UPF0335 family)